MKKFVLGKSGKSIVNAEHVQTVYIYTGENLRAAQAYLAELVAELNGGSQ